MIFSSILFLFTFLPASLLLFYLVPKGFRHCVLLFSSLFFYAWGEPVYLFLMIFSILFNYTCGIDIDRKKNNRKKSGRSLIFTIIINLLILGFFKYYGFAAETLNSFLHLHISVRRLALPIGISFYTFQTLSYIIDVYRGKVRVQKNILKFGVYVSLFPQLIAGPIVQYSDIENQLENSRCSFTMFGEGTLYFIRGLGKKLLLANSAGLIFTQLTAHGTGSLSVLGAWLGCAAYTFQIYFDFSGYSDMAVGLGQMFGFKFINNFQYPYIASSVTEFWHRWHISLGSWFREYVYIPLGGNRVPWPRHMANILIVWLLTGLWHGASFNFIVWGLYYGLLLLFEKYILKNLLPAIPGWIRHTYTILLVMIGWVFFFSPDLTYAFQYLGTMFGNSGLGAADSVALYYITSELPFWLALILGSTPIVHVFYRQVINYRNNPRVWQNTLVYSIIFLLCIAYLVTETYNPFLYFRF